MKIRSILILSCLVGITFFVWGSELSGLLEAKYQLSLVAGEENKESHEEEDEEVVLTKNIGECLEYIHSYLDQYEVARSAYDALQKSWASSSISSKDPRALALCNEILMSIQTKAEVQRKISVYRQMRELASESQKIQFHYESLNMTPKFEPTLASVDQIMPGILEAGEYHNHTASQWEDTRDMLISALTPVLEQYEQDFSTILADSDHGFWSEMDKHFALGSAPPLPPEPDLDQIIVIDLSDQMLYAYEGKYLVKSTHITSGQDKYPTRPGQYEVLEKLNGKWMNSPFPGDYYRLWVDYWIRFSWSGYGIHDTCNAKNCWRTEYGIENYTWAGSHGCVNTPYDVVKDLYHWVNIGTKVIVRQ